MVMEPSLMRVSVVGAGAMGAGIAQVAAQAGHSVLLFDVMEGAAQRGVARITSDLDGLVTRGRLSAQTRAEILDRIAPAGDIGELASSQLVIEAVVEDLEVKRRVFSQLEAIISDDCILTTNTSSISITAIAAALRLPARVAGFHFFNPAPIMKLVEVVSGAATTPAVADKLLELARAWGKIAVRAKATPGFIVNRVARPFYGEALRLLEEGATDPATLDSVYTEAGEFRMGPCMLMDLIGHDVNYAVTQSMFDAFSGDPRYRPSLIQKELIHAGWLGRKAGRGFYENSAVTRGSKPTEADAVLPLDGTGHRIGNVLVRRTDGRTAASHALEAGNSVVLYDLVADARRSPRVAVSRSPDVGDPTFHDVVSALSEGGRTVTEIADRPGLILMRTIAMLANEAFEASLHGVGSLEEIDLAMTYGVNYPRGPVAWAREIGLSDVIAIMDNLRAVTGDPRYRTSLVLRLAADEEAIHKRQAA